MFPLQPEHSLNLADLIYKIYQIAHYIDCISKTLDSKWLGSPTSCFFEKINGNISYILRDGIVSPAHASLLKAILCKPYNHYKPTQNVCQNYRSYAKRHDNIGNTITIIGNSDRSLWYSIKFWLILINHCLWIKWNNKLCSQGIYCIQQHELSTYLIYLLSSQV